MDELEGVVKELLEEYVVSHKKPETVEECLKYYGIEDLYDVKKQRYLAQLLGVNRSSPKEIRKKLFHEGYLAEVPIAKVVMSINSTNQSPYLDQDVVGAEKVEEHRKKVIESDEFAEYISGKFNSLCDVIVERGLASFLQVPNRFGTNDVRKELFELNLLTEVPIQTVIEDAHKSGSLNPYLNPEIVGKEMVEHYQKIVINSPEFKEYVESKFGSLMDITQGGWISSLLGINKDQIKTLRKELFEKGILTKVPIQRAIDNFSITNPPSYFDPEIVGAEKVEEHKQQVLESEDFAEYICNKFNSLCDVKYERWLANFVGIKENSPRAVRKALFDLGLLTEVPSQEIVNNIHKKSRYPSSYLDPKIVGPEMVEHYRRIVLESEDFANYVDERFASLTDVKVDVGLASFLGLSNKHRVNLLRKALFDQNLLTEVPVPEVIDYMYNVNLHNYLNSKIVGPEMVEHYRKIVLNSKEFKEHIESKYSSLKDINFNNSRGLANLLNVPTTQLIRQALVSRGIFTDSFSNVVQDLMESYTNG